MKTLRKSSKTRLKKRQLGGSILRLQERRFDQKYQELLKAFDEVCETKETCEWQVSKEVFDKDTVMQLLEALNGDGID